MSNKLHLPHALHTVGVEVGLAGAAHGLHVAGHKMANALAQGSAAMRPASRWTLGRAAPFLKGAARAIEWKPLGIPALGIGIDIITPSQTIMSGGHEKRLLQMERLRESRIQRPIVEQGTRYKSGVVHFPKSNQFILPPVVVKHHSQKSRPAMASRTSLKFTVRPVQKLQLSRPRLGQSLILRRPGLHAPKLHISRALSATAKTFSLKNAPSRVSSPMKLHLPKLGSSLGQHRSSFKPVQHRAPAMRGFRR